VGGLAGNERLWAGSEDLRGVHSVNSVDLMTNSVTRVGALWRNSALLTADLEGRHMMPHRKMSQSFIQQPVDC
jgi:hypothetical protein